MNKGRTISEGVKALVYHCGSQESVDSHELILNEKRRLEKLFVKTPFDAIEEAGDLGRLLADPTMASAFRVTMERMVQRVNIRSSKGLAQLFKVLEDQIEEVGFSRFHPDNNNELNMRLIVGRTAADLCDKYMDTYPSVVRMAAKNFRFIFEKHDCFNVDFQTYFEGKRVGRILPAPSVIQVPKERFVIQRNTDATPSRHPRYRLIA
jgi:hypothetical protein